MPSLLSKNTHQIKNFSSEENETRESKRQTSKQHMSKKLHL